MTNRDRSSARSGVVACILAPVIGAAVLLYQALTELRIVLTQPETIAVVLGVLLLAAGLGAVAAFAPRLRLYVLSALTVAFVDVALQPARMFDALTPGLRTPARRDQRRLADLHRLDRALRDYLRDVGPLPTPKQYGEGTGPRGFWEGWWDLSAVDGDRDGTYFLDFLADSGVLPEVPLDPRNETDDPRDPRSGSQYIYFVSPQGYRYQGGPCDRWQGRAVYMLAITRLETDAGEPVPETSNCACLWRDSPDFFRQHFAYALCGSFVR